LNESKYGIFPVKGSTIFPELLTVIQFGDGNLGNDRDHVDLLVLFRYRP